MQALIVSGDQFEDTELLVPWYRLLEENIEVDIASVQVGVITGKHGYTVTAGFSLEALVPDYYDLLILPGGKAPAELREQEPLLEIVRHFFEKEKTGAAICHGPQILVSAGVLTGRKATCYQGVAEELQEAGAEYQDAEVIVDNNLITARIPSDLPAFCREMMKQIREQEKE